MNRDAIATAIAEAERFLKAAKVFEAEDTRRYGLASGGAFSTEANVEHAAMKRASMDLTRALARMRRR